MSPSTAELTGTLHTILADLGIPGLPLVGLERSLSLYRSSFPLEELQLHLSSGEQLQVVFKDLSRDALSEPVRRVKPVFLHDPMREIETYRQILSNHPLGTARLYGAVADQRIGRFWLFLERVAGDELYKVGEFVVWQAVAAELARMHQHFAVPLRSKIQATSWLEYDAGYFRHWMRRAQEILAGKNSVSGTDRRGFARLASQYDRVVERLVSQSATFIHGEFYASNVLIKQDEGKVVRICPVDWEMAGFGPGLIDLAALVSGRWTDSEKTSLAEKYFDVLVADNPAPMEKEFFFRALDDCRLHLAVQWLGWSEHWTPPPEHAQDWLGEALSLAE